MSCYPVLTPYPGTKIYEQYLSEGRLITQDWDQYNGSTVVFQPRKMTANQLRHAQMAAFNEFYQPGSALQRLRIWPFKRNSWLANMAIHRGLVHYYSKGGRPLPRFADFLEPDSEQRFERSLGLHKNKRSIANNA